MCWQATAPLPVCQWWELGPDQRRSRRLDRWVHRPCQSLDAPRRATSADGSSCGGFRRRPPTRITRLVQHILRQVPNRFPKWINTLNLTKSSSNPRICLLTLISSLGARSLATKMCLNFAPLPKRKERQEATIKHHVISKQSMTRSKFRPQAIERSFANSMGHLYPRHFANYVK